MTRLARKLDRLARRRTRELKRRLVGEQRYTVTLLHPLEALADRRLGAGVAEFMAVTAGAAAGSGPPRECFTCCRRWAPIRMPARVLVVEFLQLGDGLVAGVCQACASDGGLMDLIIAGLARDLGAAETRVQWVGAPGHA